MIILKCAGVKAGARVRLARAWAVTIASPWLCPETVLLCQSPTTGQEQAVHPGQLMGQHSLGAAESRGPSCPRSLVVGMEWSSEPTVLTRQHSRVRSFQ